MADLVKFELNRSGVWELLNSKELEDLLLEEARKRMPSGDYEAVTFKGSTRVVARISTKSIQAAKENLANNTLLKALGRSG